MDTNSSEEKQQARSSSKQCNRCNKCISLWDGSTLISRYAIAYVWPMLQLAWNNRLGLDHLGCVSRCDQSWLIGQQLQQNFDAEVDSIVRSSKFDRRKTTNNEGPLLSRHNFVRALLRTFGWDLFVVSLFDVLSRVVAYPMQAISLGWLVHDASKYFRLRSQTFNSVLGQSKLHPGESLMNSSHYHINYTNHVHLVDDNGIQEQLQELYIQVVYDGVYLLLLTLAATSLAHPFLFHTLRVGMWCRIGACQMIFNKALRLSPQAMRQTNTGQMVNLLSNDVNRFDHVAQLAPFIITAPLQAFVILMILSKYYLGIVSTLALLMTLIAYVIAQGFMGGALSKFRNMAANRTDERVRLMNEVLGAIRVIKMYHWVDAFEKSVHKACARELRSIGWTTLIKGVNMTLYSMSSKIIVFVALMVYVIVNGTSEFTPELVFVSIGLSSLIRVALSLHFANAIAQCAETMITCKRIDKFMLLPELEKDLHIGKRDPQEKTLQRISLDRLYVTWLCKEQMIIRNLSLSVCDGELCMVVGRVGSGKSSLLLTMLGELPVASGRCETFGSVSYAAQEPWLFAGTVRDNIVFGSQFKADRYREVVRVCSLEHDLSGLTHGDQTEVGERGVSLSGGQKARINLARALYQEADVYLLDDPLSAVDTQVARYIFDQSLRQFLKRKTVVLATHQLQFLQHADKVLLLCAGTNQSSMAVFGSLDEVVKSDAFCTIEYGKEAFNEAVDQNATASELNGEVERNQVDEGVGQKEAAHYEQRLTQPVESGNNVAVSAKTYAYYLRHAFASSISIFCFLLMAVVAQLLYQSIDFYLSKWTHAMQTNSYLKPMSADMIDIYFSSHELNQICIHYELLIIACFVATGLMCAIFLLATFNASKRIHKHLTSNLLHAPMIFYEQTPIGALLNRISRDMGFVDQFLPYNAIEITITISILIGTLIMALFIDYKNLFGTVVLSLLALAMRALAVKAITRLKQLESQARTPVYGHMSTTINGLSTIRAMNRQEMFSAEFNQIQDTHTTAWFAFMSVTRWLSLTMDWICVLFILVVVSLTLLVTINSIDSASLMGLLISQMVFLPGPLQATMRQLTEVESQMTSVERIRELSDVQAEADQSRATQLVETKGESFRQVTSAEINTNSTALNVVFKDVTLRYSALEAPVLNNVNFAAKSGEKIGIVGRTGAGKSSIVSVLFRLYDFSGSVSLNGRQIKSMSLAELRQSMSIIPQDPVLFSGTLRENLDPFNQYPDEVLWDALDSVELKVLFAKHEEKLEYVIEEAGANFSTGERQLICLARAIVRRAGLLVLDEATANVDPETDALVQRTVRRQFVHCTIIVVAHRLLTIVDVDKVLVLDGGHVKEFGSPADLMRRSDSLFAQMVHSSGQQAMRIRKLIEEAEQRTKNNDLRAK